MITVDGFKGSGFKGYALSNGDSLGNLWPCACESFARLASVPPGEEMLCCPNQLLLRDYQA